MQSRVTNRGRRYTVTGDLAERLLHIAQECGAEPAELVNFMLERQLHRTEINAIPLPSVLAAEWEEFRTQVAARKRAS